MPKTVATYTLPTWAPVRWLTDAGKDVPIDVRARLNAGFFTSTASLIVGALGNMAINVLALSRHPTAYFAILVAIELALLAARICLLAASRRLAGQGRPTLTDCLMLSSIAWAAVVGFGCALCFATRDPVLQFLAPTTMMGIVSGVATRNNGAPRLAIMQISLCDIPLQFAILFAGEPWMMISLAQCPMFIIAMIGTVRRLNTAYVTAVVAERESERRANHDSLTGLLNRAGLMAALTAQLHHAVLKGDDLALLYIDLDGFKGVNDRLGHAGGDDLLRQVAERLTDVAPESCLKGRLGGDEFIIIAPRRSAIEGMAIGERVVEAVRRPYGIEGDTTLTIGVSVGIACAQPKTTVDALLAEADAALYQAKVGGKGRCVIASHPQPSGQEGTRRAA